MGSALADRIVRLGAQWAPQAVEVLVRAFEVEEHFAVVFPRARRECLGYLMHMCVHDALRFGRVDALTTDTGRIAATAVWLGPGAWPMGVRRHLASLPFLVRAAQAGGAASSLQLARYGLRTEAVHPRVPHWYLFALGVDPQDHGRGLGGILLDHGLTFADQDGVPAWLETQEERTAHWYQRRGFQQWGPIMEFPGYSSWQMLREPQPPAEHPREAPVAG